jgi:signal transduction histidine kinase
VVYNLLSNALKYCAPDRPAVVQLRCRREADTAVLEVQDNGIGLDASQQARVFGMFQRVHTHVEGAGIGLYMVKKIVENIGGTVTLRSEPGVGSTFTVSLPCAD